MGVEYLTDFANIFDIFFTGLSECGLLTKYSVQLQAALVDLELMLKFKNLIWQLIRSLQALLAKIPALQTVASSMEVATQTSLFEIQDVGSIKTESRRELVVTCHPITLTAIEDNTSFVATSDILSMSSQSLSNLCLSPDDKASEDKINLISKNKNNHSETKDCIENQSPCTKNLFQDNSGDNQDTNICELKPMRVTSEDKDCVEQDDLCRDRNTSNVVHIVVEAEEESSSIAPDHMDERDAESEREVQLHCEECDRQFKSSGSLERHLQSHSGFCNMCNQVFNCVQTLQDHCRTVHEGTGCFMCTTCGKRFMTKFSYTRHMESHGGKKGAICHVCGKSFSRADYLQTHYTIHVGKRSFECSQCPKKFVRRIQLRSHEKTHSGIKDHVCKMCNRGFARSDKLREHMLRHLNIKRYQCATCYRFYAEKRDLKTHLKVHMKT